MDTSFLFQNCYTGTDFENLMVQFLGEHGFRAKKTGSNDGGIDIIATSITRPIKYKKRQEPLRLLPLFMSPNE